MSLHQVWEYQDAWICEYCVRLPAKANAWRRYSPWAVTCSPRAMVVELIFSENETALHSIVVENADFIPVPAVGDKVRLGDNTYQIESREYFYAKREPSGMINDASVRITMACKIVGRIDSR